MVEEESCVSDGLHEVQFLVPFMKDSYVEGVRAHFHFGFYQALICLEHSLCF